MLNPAVLLVHVLYLHVTQDLQTVTKVQQMDVKQTCNQIQAIVVHVEMYVPVEVAVLMEHVAVQQDKQFVAHHLHRLEHVQTLQQMITVEVVELHAGTYKLVQILSFPPRVYQVLMAYMVVLHVLQVKFLVFVLNLVVH